MTDKEIVMAMETDPRKGFAQLMGKYSEPIYWHIRRLLVSHDDSQDAAQETFVRVFGSFGSFRGGSLKAWIYRIATNEALRVISRRKTDQCSLDDPQVAAVLSDEWVDYSDLEAVKLQKAILSLPRKQQLAFNLRYYDELDYSEIAKVTGSTAAAAKVNYHIAKNRIIDYMKTHD